MSLNSPRSGFNNTSEFQSSGLPWVRTQVISNTVVKYSFPKITKNIVVSNLNTAAANILRVGFTENGVNGVEDNYYFLLGGGMSVELDVRVKELYLLRNDSTNITSSVHASLTTIDPIMMPILTGSVGGISYWEGIG